MKKKNLFVAALKHLRTVCIHKYWVFVYCSKLGLYWRGIKHDLSKFSPTEFGESVKYYTGTCSPIAECKRKNGVSYAWLHHKGRNTHHHEYWIDYLDNGGIPVKMPKMDAFEMVCDYFAAGRAYSGKNFTFEGEWKWWLNKLKVENPKMHPEIKYFVTMVMRYCMKENQFINLKTLNQLWGIVETEHYGDEEFEKYLEYINYIDKKVK